MTAPLSEIVPETEYPHLSERLGNADSDETVLSKADFLLLIDLIDGLDSETDAEIDVFRPRFEADFDDDGRIDLEG